MKDERKYDFLNYSSDYNNSNDNNSSNIYYDNSYDSSYNYADPAYLDRFMQDCINNQDTHLSYYRGGIGSILNILPFALFFMIFIAAFTGHDGLASILFPITFISIFVVAIASLFTKKSTTNYDDSPDGINYDYIQQFLSSNKISNFDEFGKSFCVNDGTTNKTKNNYTPILIITFFILFSALIGFNFAFATINIDKLTAANMDMSTLMPFSIFGIVPIVAITYVLRTLLIEHNCTEKIDCVCVEVQSKISRNSDGHRTRLYKPYYYIKYNGKGYILFKNVWSSPKPAREGDYIKNMYINPNNPFEYCRKGSVVKLIFPILFGLIFTAPIIGIYLTIL